MLSCASPSTVAKLPPLRQHHAGEPGSVPAVAYRWNQHPVLPWGLSYCPPTALPPATLAVSLQEPDPLQLLGSPKEVLEP